MDGEETHWPLTAIDCTISTDNLNTDDVQDLKNATKKFHSPGFDVYDILQCSFKKLGGHGKGYEPGTACDHISEEAEPTCDPGVRNDTFLFGSYYNYENEEGEVVSFKCAGLNGKR